MPTRAPSFKLASPMAKQFKPKEESRAGLYGRRWAKQRLAFLQRPENALCKHCQAEGKIMPSQEVDHIIPWRRGASREEQLQLFWDEANWMGLCKSCHAHKTAREDGGFGNPRSK